jgi:hypothetical protein
MLRNNSTWTFSRSSCPKPVATTGLCSTTWGHWESVRRDPLEIRRNCCPPEHCTECHLGSWIVTSMMTTNLVDDVPGHVCPPHHSHQNGKRGDKSICFRGQRALFTHSPYNWSVVDRFHNLARGGSEATAQIRRLDSLETNPRKPRCKEIQAAQRQELRGVKVPRTPPTTRRDLDKKCQGTSHSRRC